MWFRGVAASMGLCFDLGAVLEGYIKNLALRIPGWCERFEISTDGKENTIIPEKGFCRFDDLRDCTVTLDLDLSPKYNYAPKENKFCAGKAEVSVGPFIMCAEGEDNPAILTKRS